MVKFLLIPVGLDSKFTPDEWCDKLILGLCWWQPDTSTTPLPMRYASIGYISMGFISMGYTSSGHLKF